MAQYSDTEHGEEPLGLQVTVVEQQPLDFLDYSLFQLWMAASQDLQLNVQARAAHEPEDVLDPVARSQQTWTSFRKAVRDFDVDIPLGDAAGDSDEETCVEHRRSRALRVEHVAQYLSSFATVAGDSSHLEVLKDELTCVQELISWEEPLVSEGFRAPEEMANRSSESDMKELSLLLTFSNSYIIHSIPTGILIPQVF